MALQDLTPQLRTRLSRVERAVGLFVTVATLVLLAGFAYYIHHTASRKGWFKTKIEYQTSLGNATGLKVGDAVKLMGFSVGEITRVEANAPGEYYNVTVYFRVKEPYYGYIWLDSRVRVAPADFLGNRNLEIIKGQSGVPTVLEKTAETPVVLDHQTVREQGKKLLETLVREIQAADHHEELSGMEAETLAKHALPERLNRFIREKPGEFYVKLEKAKPYWIEPLESPALTERLESIVNGVEAALPDILRLTNRINGVLAGAAKTTDKMNLLLDQLRPAASNVAVITGNLREPRGSLGEWLLPDGLRSQIEHTLSSARTALEQAQTTLQTADTTLAAAGQTLGNTDTNLTLLVSNLNLSLVNLAELTGGLNSQVQANTNILSEISKAIVDTDDLVQGIKRHWLLRSAFKTNKTDNVRGRTPLPAPKDR